MEKVLSRNTVEVVISIPGLVEGQKKKEGSLTLVAFQFLAWKGPEAILILRAF